ncbi:hypothetical protein AKJ64_00905 [candidate division MSBL1 archaeon SCGC-AAA259E17]|uniref:YgjP-like metallopeptidase domain-containing protein n=1 Tax=candidate division MSBL1 archaeon SCGC-AAA259E17 TaxID=1698263 RepID=A0A133UGG8_9EURY|nr:hypothetical protein AKJ64_00905 [candidate division MSBL1 archaeon SCGC-AAA259E17]
MKKTELLGEDIEYTVRRSSKATIPRVDVSMDGVRAVIPEGSDKDPEGLLQEKAIQVIKSKKKFDRYREEIPKRKFQEGEFFPYLGEEHNVAVSSEHSDRKVEGEKLILPADEVKDTSIKRELEKLYREKAREIIEEILERYEDLRIEYKRIKLKNQKTRWASCSSRQNLNFNWRIAMAPKDIIEYVVVHELVHLEESNHSKRFWTKVSSILPDYKERAKWLKDHSPKLVFSEEDYTSSSW